MTGNSNSLSESEMKKRDQMVESFFTGNMTNFKIDISKSKVDVEALRVAFSQIDSNQSGMISPNQLKQFLVAQGLSTDESTKHVEAFVKTHSGCKESLRFEDFVEEFVRMQNFILLRTVQAKFEEIDKDHSGSIDKAEFHSLLSQLLGPQQASQQVDQLFLKTDTNHDGVLSLKEFAAWYCTYTLELRNRRDRTKQATAEELKALDEASFHKLQAEHDKDLERLNVVQASEKDRQNAKLEEALARKKAARKASPLPT
jgi:Ca2+-binding EF-hand superfamily protein